VYIGEVYRRGVYRRSVYRGSVYRRGVRRTEEREQRRERQGKVWVGGLCERVRMGMKPILPAIHPIVNLRIHAGTHTHYRVGSLYNLLTYFEVGDGVDLCVDVVGGEPTLHIEPVPMEQGGAGGGRRGGEEEKKGEEEEKKKRRRRKVNGENVYTVQVRNHHYNGDL
jgi:hypothetical protein